MPLVVSRVGFQLLPVSGEHAAAVEQRRAATRTPPDRLLVAQALHEPMRLLTHVAGGALQRHGGPGLVAA
jgi:PIN domain nuclease of toxin-antitoxin system